MVKHSTPSQTMPVLYGLILAGGHSRRMGRDKSQLCYHGKEQTYFTAELIKPFCKEIFLSNRAAQKDLRGHQGLNQIHDNPEFKGIGPLGGILSAMKGHPMTAWLVVACDLPLLDRPTLKNLIDNRDTAKVATAYHSSHDTLPEPLCAIYEPSFYSQLLNFRQDGITCPRKIMRRSDVKLLELANKKALDNANTPNDTISLNLTNN